MTTKQTPNILTPTERERRLHYAFCEACLSLNIDDIVKMAKAVGWKWLDQTIDTDAVLDTLKRLHMWLLQVDLTQPIDVSSCFTGGFYIMAHEYVMDGYEEDDPQTVHITVTIVWGPSGEGDSP